MPRKRGGRWRGGSQGRGARNPDGTAIGAGDGAGTSFGAFNAVAPQMTPGADPMPYNQAALVEDIMQDRRRYSQSLGRPPQPPRNVHNLTNPQYLSQNPNVVAALAQYIPDSQVALGGPGLSRYIINPQDLYANDGKMMFGVDEISALVLDPGTAWTRAGFAGEDTPKAVIPSDYGFVPDESAEKFGGKLFIGDNAVHTVREKMEIRNPMKEGIVQDWDVAPEIWRYAISNRLTANTNEHPLLMIEPAWNPTKNREKSVEFAFEDFNVPAFFLAKSAVCAAFSSGKGTALIVDIGHGQASVTPVCDGLVLKKGLVKSNLAGAHLNTQLRHQLSNPPISAPLHPHFYISSKTHYSDPANAPEIPLRSFGFEPTTSFTEFQQDRIFHEFKETTSQVWNNYPLPLPLDASAQGSDFITPRGFEFPNGYSTIFSNARYVAAESLFNPATAPLSVQPTGATAPLGIAAMISKSLNEVDADIRPTLLNNVVVTGGTSLLYGFNDRLNSELNAMFPSPKVKLSAPGNTSERKYAGWIGGSVLGSLGAFHQMWISKQEYEEVGAGIVEKRCK